MEDLTTLERGTAMWTAMLFSAYIAQNLLIFITEYFIISRILIVMLLWIKNNTTGGGDYN